MIKQLCTFFTFFAVCLTAVAQTDSIPVSVMPRDAAEEILPEAAPLDTFVPFEPGPIAEYAALPDSVDLPRLEHKSFWRASAEVVGMNLGLWAYDRYIQKGEFAYISWESIKNNFKHGFEWDNDYLGTNMFAHPYNGSLFYNAGRSNGFNFWQSELFAIGGSAMWEMFMEKEYPSTNDIIATPIGGAAIGEVLYRTSDLILDDRSQGGERFGREFAAFLVSPMRGLTRIFTGRAWEHRATSGRRFGIPPISVELSLGTRLLTLRQHDRSTVAGGCAEISIEYGDRFAEESHVPYDYFSFLLELQAIKSQPFLGRVEIIGRLLSRDVADDGRLKVNVGLYQHFDYFDSDTIRPEHEEPFLQCPVPYKFGTPASVGGGAMFRYQPWHSMSFDGYLHLNGVVLAGVLTDFYHDYHRNYNWGSGFSLKMGVGVTIPKLGLTVKAANQFYQIYTWNGYDIDYYRETMEAPVNVQGDASRSRFNHFEVAADYRIWRRLWLAFGLDFYTRHTRYNMEHEEGGFVIADPVIESRQLGCHLMLTYKL